VARSRRHAHELGCPTRRLSCSATSIDGQGRELFYEQPLHLVRGSGVWLSIRKDTPISTCTQCTPVGHAHPAVVPRCRARPRSSQPTRESASGILEYAERLLSKLPARLNACIFVNWERGERRGVAHGPIRHRTRGAVVMQKCVSRHHPAVAALKPGVGQAREPHVVTLAAPQAGLQPMRQRARPQLAAAGRMWMLPYEPWRKGLRACGFLSRHGVDQLGSTTRRPPGAPRFRREFARRGLIVADESNMEWADLARTSGDSSAAA